MVENATRRTALAVGSQVPCGDFGFRVHSVFGAAMNLAVAGRRGLVTLVDADGDDYPHGIRLATRERFDAWPAPAGTPGRREGEALLLGGAPGGEPLTIGLPAAARATRRAPPRIAPGGRVARGAWAICARRLEARQREQATDLRLAGLCGPCPPPTRLGARLAEAARALEDGVRGRDAGLAGHAAARLMGLGPGLTPAGDDFLCGLLAALWCASEDGGRDRRFAVEWGATLAARLDATNVVSATFLECAIAGCFPGAVCGLAAAFAGRRADHRPGDAGEALDRLCARGHSSGMDTATGFLFGLRLRADEEVRRHAPQFRVPGAPAAF
jgi:hypothetical protein